MNSNGKHLLYDTIRRHDGSGNFNMEVLRQAGDYESLGSAYYIRDYGSEHFRWTHKMIHNLPLPVALDWLNVLADGLPVAVVSRERCDGTVPPGLRAV